MKERETIWIPIKDNREILTYQLIDKITYEKFKDNENDPNYVKGLEYEPCMLYIIPTGFKDLYHVIIGSGFDIDNTYQQVGQTLNSEKIKKLFDINLKEEVI